MKQVILASGSQGRKKLLKSLGIRFKIIPADIDEKAIRDSNPKLMGVKIATAKAEEVAKNNQGIIIAADTFEVYKGEIMEKPRSLKEAREMLLKKSGQTCEQITGFCYLDAESSVKYTAGFVSQATYRELSEEEIERYINKYPVLNWAGAFDPTVLYCASMIAYFKGPLNGYYGLPLDEIVVLLDKSGVKVNP